MAPTGTSSIQAAFDVSGPGSNALLGANREGMSETFEQADTTTALSASETSLTWGEWVTFTARVVAAAPSTAVPSGTITFMDGTTELGTRPLVGGFAAFETSGLTVGDHSITAVFAGSADFAASSSNLTENIASLEEPLLLSASLDAPVFGQQVRFTATVNALDPETGDLNPDLGTPTGTVRFLDNGTLLGTVTLDGNGQATLSTSGLSAADHEITAIYEGDAQFDSCSVDLAQSVAQAGTATSLASNSSDSAYGESVTFTATVLTVAPGVGAATGWVTFWDGGTLLDTVMVHSGQATYTTLALGVGDHDITADYAGDTNFASSSDEILQTVELGSTTTAITASANPSVYGHAITFTAIISADSDIRTPTGHVTFMDDDCGVALAVVMLDANGQAMFSTSALTANDHTIAAYYEGDAQFASSELSLSEQITQVETSTAVTVSANPSLPGQSVTFTATVSALESGTGTPTGSVYFEDSSGDWSAEMQLDASGHASASTLDLGAGSHTITVRYRGDDNFSESSASLTETVSATATTTTLGASANPLAAGQSAIFTATVRAIDPDADTPTGSVYFEDSLGDWSDEVQLDANGNATVSTSDLGPGDHTITATYEGDDSLGESSVTLVETVLSTATTTTITASVNPLPGGQTVTFTAAIAAVDPRAGAPTGSVHFEDITGNWSAEVPLDASGQASAKHFGSRPGQPYDHRDLPRR